MAFIFTFFDYITVKYLHHFPVPLSIFFDNLVIFVIFYFALSRRGFLIFYSIICLIQFIAFIHLDYFGRLLSPLEIYLFFTNIGEINDALLNSELSRYGFSFLFAALMVFCGILFYILVKNTAKLKIPFLSSILLILLFINPIKTFYLSQIYYRYFKETPVYKSYYGSQPITTRSSIVNFYKSLSYAVPKIFPDKLIFSSVKNKNDFSPQTLKINDKDPNLNIIFVLGESLRSQNLSMFGYPFPTSPKLDEWVNTRDLLAFKMISGSVATSVSLPLLFNDSYGASAPQTVLNSSKCLFNLAKNNGFKSFFYSPQGAASLKEIYSYLCPTSADIFQIPEIATGYDEELLTQLKKINLDKGHQFVVLHQNGSHDPYNTKYPPNFVLRKPELLDDFATARIKHYDNSVYYTDSVLDKILSYVKETSSDVPTIFILTSDHGESLGENGVWGHVHLKDDFVYSVPFFIWSSDPTNPVYLQFKKILPQKIQLTHSAVSSALVNLLGYDEPVDIEKKDFMVLGPDLFGEGGSHIVPTFSK